MNAKRKRKKRDFPETSRAADAPSDSSPRSAPEPPTPLWRALAAEPIAIGLSLFVLLRPWRDGLTFPPFNTYFTAFIVFLAALWGVRLLLRNERIAFPLPTALLAGYLLVAYLTGFNSIEHYLTHRTLHYLVAYFLLFLLCSNALRTPLSVGMVLGAFLLGTLLNAAWSIVHYYETLPAMREILIGSPDILFRYFGTRELTPELQSRLEMNRAFGTFLFPNALGAFIILGLPLIFSQLRPSWRIFRARLRSPEPETPRNTTATEQSMRAWTTFGAACTVWLVTFVVPLLVNERLGGMNIQGDRPVESLAMQIVLFGLLPVVLCGASGALVWRHGLKALGLALRALGVSTALPVSLYTLWLTYSRGAVAALGLAVLLALGLYFLGGRIGRTRVAVSRTAVVFLVLVFLLKGLGVPAAPAAHAQELRDPGMKPTDFRLERARRDWLEKEESRPLSVEGRGRGMGHLGDMASFGLRVTYWQVGLLMFQDNFLTGVGLGTFKIAYPAYQFLGAGDVEMAHNDYLQAFCETGVLGGALFSAFWIYFVVWGGRRILQEADASRRALLAAHYAGVVAFCAHALVDFNFANPSLASFAFILAGTFYAHAKLWGPESEPDAEKGVRLGRFIALPLLLLLAVSAGSVVRMFLFDYALTEGTGGRRLLNIGERRSLQTRTEAAKFFLNDPKMEKLDPRDPPVMALRQAYALIPDEPLLESFGAIWVRVEGGRSRRLRPDESAPENALLVIDPAEAARVRQEVIEAAKRWIDVLKDWDALYPHDPDVASRIFLWYDLLFANVDEASERKRFARAALDWSRTAVERSPRYAWNRLYYAKALWLRGSLEKGQASLDYYNEGLGEYKTACDLYPHSEVFWSHYGQALQKLGKALKNAGRTQESAAMLEQAAEALRHSNRLVMYKSVA